MRPTPNSRFNFVQVESEALLYDNETHDVIHLDPPGAIIWSLCDGKRDVEEIVRLIGDAYPESRASVATDVASAIDKLVSQGVLTMAP